MNPCERDMAMLHKTLTSEMEELHNVIETGQTKKNRMKKTVYYLFDFVVPPVATESVKLFY